MVISHFRPKTKCPECQTIHRLSYVQTGLQELYTIFTRRFIQLLYSLVVYYVTDFLIVLQAIWIYNTFL